MLPLEWNCRPPHIFDISRLANDTRFFPEKLNLQFKSMHSTFPLFNTACDLSHSFWKPLLNPGDTVIDATLGNGQDTLFLARVLLGFKEGELYGFDIQEKAVEKTRELILTQCGEETGKRIHLFKESHDKMDRYVKKPVKLIVYNLGYLPGGDKTITTVVESTLSSVAMGLDMLGASGVLSITCYPGHPEGQREEQALIDYFTNAAPAHYSVSHFRLLNRKRAPSLILVQKPSNPA